MTKPAPLARLGLPPATSFEPGGVGFPLTVPFAGALSADSRRLALFRAGPFRRLRHEPGVRRPGVRRRAALPRTGCRRLRFRLVRAQQAVRWEPFEPENLLGGIPAKDPSGSGYDGRRFRDADVRVVPFPALRQRWRGQSGDAAPPRLLLQSVSASLAPQQNAGNSMRLASAGGSREQRTGTLPVPGREQRRTRKRPREQVLL